MKLYKLSIPLALGIGLVLALLLAIGPVRAEYVPQTIVVNTTTDEFGTGADCSLREAIQAVNTGADFGGCVYNTDHRILLSSATYVLSLAGSDEDDNATGDLDIEASMIIQGNGPAMSTISANSIDRVFDIQPDAGQVIFTGVAIQDGVAGASNYGGGVYIDSSTAAFTNTAIIDNAATTGGGIYAVDSTITLSDTEIVVNMANNGGGLYLDNSNAWLMSGQISENGAYVEGGAVYVSDSQSSFRMTGGDIARNSGMSRGGGVLVYNGNVSLSAGRIIDNSAPLGGGVCLSGGSFTMDGGEIVSNTFTTDGGGVYMEGTTSTFNLASPGLIAYNGAANNGAGIYVNGGSLSINGGQILANISTEAGGGIFIINQGSMAVSEGEILHNEARYGGGLFATNSTAAMTGTQVFSNTSTNGGGLFLENTSVITLTGVQISDNFATMDGGGIFHSHSVVLLRNSRILNNEAGEDGGGIYFETTHLEAPTAVGFEMIGGEISHNTAGIFGGGVALYQPEDMVIFKQVAVTANTATNSGGGFYVRGDLALENITISHNQATSGTGGGIYSDDTEIIIQHTTIANNTATSGGGIYHSDGTITVQNTVLAYNQPVNCGLAPIISSGFNLDSGNTCNFDQLGDQHNANPKLGPLQNNGGSGPTRALLHGSPAIDAGLCIPSIRVDQRNWQRPNPNSSFCDIGAFEANTGGLTDMVLTKSVTPESAAPGEPVTYTLTYSHSGPSGAVQVVIEDLVPDSVTVEEISSTGAAITLIPGTHYVWRVEDLTPIMSGTITIRGVLNVPLAAGSLANNATIASSAQDVHPANNTSTAVLTVLQVAPVALDNSYSTAEDTPLSVAAPGVLGNDTDDNEDALAAVLDAGPQHGTLALNADGSFVYSPTLDYVGTDTFTYQASDGSLSSNVATVTVNIGEANDAPAAVDDEYTADEDVSLIVAAPGVLANDSDPEGDTLLAVLDAAPDHGDLTLNADGSFSYTPDADYTGEDSFTYHASDGSLSSNVATVTITVNQINDAPVAQADSYTTGTDIPLNIAAPGVLANDDDLEGDPLTAMVNIAPGFGTLLLNADGSFGYTPNPGYTGDDQFTYWANDGIANSTAVSVTIHVGAANTPPIASADSYTLTQNSVLTMDAPGLLANDSDPDADTLFVVLDSAPAEGALALEANGAFVYTPPLDFTGVLAFTYHASDGQSSSETVTVTITVIQGARIYLPLIAK